MVEDSLIEPVSVRTKIAETMLQSILVEKYPRSWQNLNLNWLRRDDMMYIYVWTASSLVKVMVFSLAQSQTLEWSNVDILSFG